ncbi:predicted protein [Lichtheimia corymbifera JMRC:FSU:9682]|uniref:Uncharacterized protein n=1 Tax=Lichtheimia corymbifera JMRC:FSU:9682 TaxID=1263082 RepID=A0A068S775_9FUNG|nr:predicted protein [Lichtheimia corymbifera JMRC:FSU:9682]
MTHSIWDGLCKQPVLTASTEKHTKLVHDASTQLQQPIESILSTLNLRSKLLTECANYDAALRDAKVMQQISPSSALGYLREATIHSEQGKQHHAIDICNKGLYVVEANDPDYGTLQRAKHDAEQHLKHRVDFLKQLPIDIVTTTLIRMIVDDDYMDPYEPSPSLYVSHLWCDRILQTFGGLCFAIGEKEDDNLSAVIEFAPHIKTLKVELYTKGTWLGDLIGNNNFCSLRKLQIEDFGSIHVGNFVSSLKSISNTLTDLTVDMDMECGSMLRVPEVVFACPNLRMLEIIEPHDADVSILPATTWPTMTTLSLTYTRTDITCNQIIDIWKRFPSLKKLELYPCSDIQSALIVPEYCPRMKSLQLCMEGMGIRLIYSEQGDYSEGPGIRKLMIETNPTADKICKDTSSIIKQYHTMLEHLEWEMNTSEDRENIDHLEFSCLKKFGFFGSGLQLLHNAPILEELMITSQAINMHPQVLDTIPPHLKSLELKFIRVDALDYELKQSLLLYLNRIALQHQLKQLAIHFNNIDSDASILDAVHGHSHLECLKVSVKREWDSYHMERFVDGLVRSCPLLSTLKLKCKNAPSTDSINILKRLSHLNQLAFSTHGTGGADTFWDAISTFTQLTSITIYPSTGARDPAINYLKQQRPDIKITIHKDAIHP